jgi:hypothetical protein
MIYVTWQNRIYPDLYVVHITCHDITRLTLGHLFLFFYYFPYPPLTPSCFTYLYL